MPMSSMMQRRKFLTAGASLAALSLAGCATNQVRVDADPAVPADVLRMYAAVPDEPFPIPAVNLSRFDHRFWRDVVPDTTGERPGSVVVNTAERYLYVTRGDGYAVRYGVGIGKEGFAWSGRGYIGRKQAWPTWTPPAEMIERDPTLEEHRNGMAPGPMNPLGARALYIYADGRDTLYRLHGNPDEASIGRAVSSGCVRLLQQDVIDLYSRVPVDTPVIVV